MELFPMFSSNSFTVWGFTFKLSINFSWFYTWCEIRIQLHFACRYPIS
jgi:hypothetical protein